MKLTHMLAAEVAAAFLFGATNQAVAQAAPAMPGPCWFGSEATGLRRNEPK